MLARDNYQCQIRLPKCTGTATTVDHIQAIIEGGHPYDERNLRAACMHCNTSLGGALGNRRRGPNRRRGSREW